MIARPYQEKAIYEIKKLYAAGDKRVLLQLATGGGKTFIFSTILKGIAEKNKRAVMAVRGRALVDQASRRLDEMGVDHGVYMSNHKRFDEKKPIQIASIDTIRSRSAAPPADLVVIDEAHFAVSKSFKNFLANYENAFWLSVTATPWADGGLLHLVTSQHSVVYPISIEDLVSQGFLCPGKYFAPTNFDDSEIGTRSGEFIEEDALVQFEKQSIYGDVVSSYKKLCVGELTFVFCINVAHANKMKDIFDAQGISSAVITAETKLEDRLNLIEQNNVIISISTLLVGVDVPRLRNIIVCRPTQSKNVHVQMLGRGTRIHPGKEFFRVIDHVGNIARHGFLIDEKKVLLEAPRKNKSKQTQNKIPIKTCPNCFLAVPIAEKKCGECGHQFPQASLPDIIPSELKELDLDIRSRMKLRAKYFLNLAWSNGYKPGFIYFKLKEEFGEDSLRKYYQVYRSAKKQYDIWLDERASAPCAFGSAKFGLPPANSFMEADNWQGPDRF